MEGEEEEPFFLLIVQSQTHKTKKEKKEEKVIWKRHPAAQHGMPRPLRPSKRSSRPSYTYQAFSLRLFEGILSLSFRLSSSPPYEEEKENVEFFTSLLDLFLLRDTSTPPSSPLSPKKKKRGGGEDSFSFSSLVNSRRSHIPKAQKTPEIFTLCPYKSFALANAIRDEFPS
ncbi:hypothetical protein CSUI_007013 [Cystoisospora suis]|uniref:Uncharacterized protein n=1 Tax=Cystoisospora suis TaxID=483139 RepID=A0A2C6KRI2_9APIC|nr:hypothetical protein CSUI_007013 [Cystoisospora suis]